jgi:hypothetical protein
VNVPPPAEFVRTVELAAVGKAATLHQIPKIRQLLTRLDPQLFRFSNEATAHSPADVNVE